MDTYRKSTFLQETARSVLESQNDSIGYKNHMNIELNASRSNEN